MIKRQTEEQLTMLDLGSWSGKTSQELSQAITAEISKQSSRKSLNSQNQPRLMFLYLKTASGLGQDASQMRWVSGVLHGEHTTLNTGEYPSEERGSRLSQILEEHPHQKYSLSPTACAGILRRAEKRGKALPEALRKALTKQAQTTM